MCVSFQAKRLKVEQEALLAQHWEVERMEHERRKAEEDRKKSNLGYETCGMWTVKFSESTTTEDLSVA